LNYRESQIQRDKMNYSYDIIDMRDIACEELIHKEGVRSQMQSNS